MQHDVGLERVTSTNSGVGVANENSRFLSTGPTVAGRRSRTSLDSADVLLSTPGARIILTVSEAAAVLMASVASGLGYSEIFLHRPGQISAYVAVGMLAALLYAGAMYGIDGARRMRTPLNAAALRDAAVVWIGVILLITFLAFSLKASAALSRGALLSFLLVGYSAIFVTRAVAPGIIFKHYRPARFAAPQAVVIGALGCPSVNDIVSELRSVGFPEPTVVELCTNCSDAEWHAELPAAIGRIFSAARTGAHGDICIAAGGFAEQRLRDITSALQVIPRSVQLIPDAATERLLHLPIRNVGKLYSVEVQKSPMNAAQRFVKRALDLGISIPLLAFIAPLMVLIAIAIKLDSRGPVFFRQKRLGHRSHPFEILKFRSMTVLENGEAITQAQRNDARVTRVGRWLRVTSLDELPQLINVIQGQMSLVGPRPHAVAHDKLFSKFVDNYEIRQHVKPGITGWAQVNGLRGETASVELMRQRVEFDMWYAKNASPWFDLKILLFTIVEVLRQRNAY